MLAIGSIVMAVFALPFGATSALACNGEITQLDTPAGTFYIDDRGATDGGFWIHQESNGEAGLQSGGNSAVFGELDQDSCADPAGGPPDTLIY